jgi:hypothetical protein
MSARSLGARGALRGALPGARKKSASEPAGLQPPPGRSAPTPARDRGGRGAAHAPPVVVALPPHAIRARAKRSHTQRRACQAPPVAQPHTLLLPIPLPGLPPLTDARLRTTPPAVRARAAQARSPNRAVAQARGGRASPWPGRLRPGGNCPKTSGRGRPSCTITAAGAKEGFGSASSSFCSRKAPLLCPPLLFPLPNRLSGAVVLASTAK